MVGRLQSTSPLHIHALQDTHLQTLQASQANSTFSCCHTCATSTPQPAHTRHLLPKMLQWSPPTDTVHEERSTTSRPQLFAYRQPLALHSKGYAPLCPADDLTERFSWCTSRWWKPDCAARAEQYLCMGGCWWTRREPKNIHGRVQPHASRSLCQHYALRSS